MSGQPGALDKINPLEGGGDSGMSSLFNIKDMSMLGQALKAMVGGAGTQNFVDNTFGAAHVANDAIHIAGVHKA